MERACFYLRIFPGTEAEYDRRHAEIWPELVDGDPRIGAPELLRLPAGHRRLVLHRGRARCRPTRVRRPRAEAGEPALEPLLPRRHRADHRRLPASCSGTTRSSIPTGRRWTGRSSVALFGLVIDPERADDYEALHANPWPDLMEAIEASGFRNYNGFRRGAHVVYYGEFYPDMATVFAQDGRARGQRALGRRVRGDHHDHHRRRRQPDHRRRDLPPGLMGLTASGRPAPRSGSSARTGRSGSTRPDRRSGADRLALARSVADGAGRVDRAGRGRRDRLRRGRRGGRSPVRRPRRRGRARPPDDGRSRGLDDGRHRDAARDPGRASGRSTRPVSSRAASTTGPSRRRARRSGPRCCPTCCRGPIGRSS